MRYALTHDDGPAPLPMEPEEEILFPAKLCKISRKQFDQWIAALIKDPEHDHIGRMLKGLYGEVQRAEAAEQRCKMLERELFDLRSDQMVLDARIERLERAAEPAPSNVHPLFETALRSIRPGA